MYTVLINVSLGVALSLTLWLTDSARWGWSIVWGVAGFIGAQIITGLYVQRLVKKSMSEVEMILKDGQRRLQRKASMLQSRPSGSIKHMQMELERDQRGVVRQALEATSGLERFKRWSPLLGRQLATMRLQFHWMLKDFKKVDELMPAALVMDPTMACIRLARMYMLEQSEGMEDFFKKQTRRLRYGQGATLYGLYAWILLRRKELDQAHKVLLRACENMENATLKRNLEYLTNNRPELFSNAGLGEEWYALHLEQPRVKVQRQRQPNFGRPF